MRRRKFLVLIGAAAASWPLAVRSQQAARVRQVGMLMVLSENDPAVQAQLPAFRKALEEQGWTEGRDVRFEVRWAAGEIERVRKYAAELVQLAPDAILGNGTPVLAALKQATHSIDRFRRR
jgi:putative tryptophan/tyrosine transport system substrate-binding protein